jgi:leucyl aminopeptidase
MDFLKFKFDSNKKDACPIHLIKTEELDDWLDGKKGNLKNWINSSGFVANLGEVCLIPDSLGNLEQVLVGLGSKLIRKRERFTLGGVTKKLPNIKYDIVSKHEELELTEHYLGWLLSQYKFTNYVKKEQDILALVKPLGVDGEKIEKIAQGEILTRDLVNTPANDMGPNELEEVIRDLAKMHGASVNTVLGNALLEHNFPMIHAVGRASVKTPRLIELVWGSKGPTVTLVGKGVCFDTGGLNIKSSSGMALMKKDMGGAATVIGLSHMIMAMGLPLRLRMLVPAVENSLSSNAFRPKDILTSRKGLTVEINNTDAEGRLILADTLSYADETTPDLLICMATLTGAARVAVGSDLAPFYTDNECFSNLLDKSSRKVRDPVWRMPFHTPYEKLIEPGIANLDNAPGGGFAGSITAALFLRRFVENAKIFAHFDIYTWQPSPAPGRPKGGVGMGARAIFDALPDILKL